MRKLTAPKVSGVHRFACESRDFVRNSLICVLTGRSLIRSGALPRTPPTMREVTNHYTDAQHGQANRTRKVPAI